MGSGGTKAAVLTGLAVGGAVFTGGASLGLAAGVGAATAIGSGALANSVPKAVGLPAISDIPAEIGSAADKSALSSAQEIIKKRRTGAVGVLERRGGKSGKTFSGLLKQSETRGGLLVG